MHIGVPLETQTGETRVAATPETIKKLIGQGHKVTVQSGAGINASVPDSTYEAAGATIGSANDAFGAELILKVVAPNDSELALIKSGTVLVGMLNPFSNETIAKLAERGITAFALEAAPRTSRAQSLDVLSSQANIAGYKAVLLAAHYYPRFMPMLMTAAGTVKAARVLILGAGVAGLQAIATAKRLGAVIEASDVRPAVRSRSNPWVPSSSTSLTKPMKSANAPKALVATLAQCQPVGCSARPWPCTSAPSRRTWSSPPP